MALEFKGTLAIGIENPVIPNNEGDLKRLITRGYELEVDFINLNELEFSESNYQELIMRGFSVNDDGISACGSEETALRILKWALSEGIDMNIHYCPARFKDAHQFRLRMYWRGLRSKRVFEVVSRDGVVTWALIKLSKDTLNLYLRDLAIPLNNNKLQINPRITKCITNNYELVEAYPTNPRRILNVSWINV